MGLRRVTIRWFMFSLLLTTVLAIPASLVLVPPIQRDIRLRQLTDPDPRRRGVALNYVARNAGRDPRIVDAVVARLDNLNDSAMFQQMVTALAYAGQWKRPTIPGKTWMRWLEIYAAERNPESRVIAAQRLGELADMAGDATLARMLRKLSTDTDANVRYNALVAAAMVSSAPKASAELQEIVAALTTDETPEIARQAYLFAGSSRALAHTTELNAAAATQPSAWSHVRQARLWAIAVSAPESADTAKLLSAALLDPRTPADERAMAGYCLHALPPDTAVAIAGRLFDLAGVSTQRDTLRRAMWRAMLAVTDGRKLSKPSRMRIAGCAARYYEWFAPTHRVATITTSPATVPSVGEPDLMVAARLALLLPRESLWATIRPASAPTATSPDETDTWSPDDDPWQTLAVLEFLPRDAVTLKVPAGAPDLLRIAAADTTANPRAADLFDALESDETAFRDVACVVAAQRMSQEDRAWLVRKLLLNYNDDAKVSGAILAGLTGLEPELLDRRAEAEDRWTVLQMMKLGRWMQGRMPELDNGAKNLMLRTDIPKSTVMLALLHKRRAAALDYVLNPKGEPLFDVIAMIDQRRWWRVVKAYLPDDAPPYWVWADRDLNAFQLDALRNWYAVNRSRMYPGQ